LQVPSLAVLLAEVLSALTLCPQVLLFSQKLAIAKVAESNPSEDATFNVLQESASLTSIIPDAPEQFEAGNDQVCKLLSRAAQDENRHEERKEESQAFERTFWIATRLTRTKKFAAVGGEAI